MGYRYSVTITYSAENKKEYLFKDEKSAEKFFKENDKPMVAIRMKELKTARA